MTSIDNRVVNMQFNNGQFENNVHTSIRSLDELKKGLDLQNQAKALQELDKAGKNFTLAGIAEGVEKLTERFSTLGIIGFTVLQNLTNSAINLGKRLKNAFIIEPMKMGFSEYELKLNSIQTILTNTARYGTTLDDVGKALDELNDYSDKTIYNFAQMTDNVGKFTAAGLKLDDAVVVVKGMANVAAGFGVEATRMAGATYQMSQALQPGRFVNLMDWKSMETAGMAGLLLQEELLKTAKNMGVFVDESKGFRLSLEQGWLSSEIFIETMRKMAEDPALLEAATKVRTFKALMSTLKETRQSGWAVSWEKIFGNATQAAAFFTAINDGWKASIEGSAGARNAALGYWNEQGGRAALIEGIANILIAIGKILKPIEEGFGRLIPDVTGERLVALSVKFKKFTEKLQVTEKVGDLIKRSFDGLFSLFNVGKGIIFSIVGAFGNAVTKMAPLRDVILGATAAIGDMFVEFDNAIKATGVFSTIASNLAIVFTTILDIVTKVATALLGFILGLGVAQASAAEYGEEVVAPIQEAGGAIESLVSIISSFATRINGALSNIKSKIDETFTLDPANFERNLNTVLFTGVLVGFTRFIWYLSSLTKSTVNVVSKISSILGGVSESLEAFQSAIKANVLKTIAISIAILAASLIALSMVDSKKLVTAFTAITALFLNLFAAMGVFVTLFGKGGSGAGKVGLFANLLKTVGALMLLSVAVLILAVAVKKLSGIPWQELAFGLGSVIALIGALAAFTKLADFSSFSASAGVAMVLLATSLIILAGAVKLFSMLKLEELLQGLTTIGIILLGFAGFAKIISSSTANLATAGIGILAISVAIGVLGLALRALGGMDVQVLQQGLIALAAVMALLAITLSSMPKTLFGIGVQASVLLALGVSVRILASALSVLGHLSLQQMAIGLAALAGTFGILVGTLVLLAPLSANLMLLSGAIALLGVGMLGVGVGVAAFATGLGALAISGAAGARALADVFRKLIDLLPYLFQQIAVGVVGVIQIFSQNSPMIAAAFVQILTDMATAVATTIPKILEIFIKMTKDVIGILINNTPEFIKAGAMLLYNFLVGLLQNLGQILDVGIQIVLKFIAGITSRMGDIVQAGFEFIISFLDGMAVAVDNNADRVISAIGRLAVSIIEALVKGLANLAVDLYSVGKNAILGFIKGIKDNSPKSDQAMVNAATGVVDAAKQTLDVRSPSGIFIGIGENLVAGLTAGVDKNAHKAEKSTENMAKKVAKSGAKVAGEANKASKSAFDAAVEWIDDRKYYNLLSLEEELAAWQDLQKKYIEGTEERKKADREVYRVQQELRKKDYDDAVAWIEDRKYYNELSFAQELDAWKKIQTKYIEGTEERKKADREVYRVQQELLKAQQDYAEESIRITEESTKRKAELEQQYADRVKQIEDQLASNIESLNEQYDSALKSRAKALNDAYGLFDKIQKQPDVKGSALISNLEGQVDQFKAFKDGLAGLSGKGVDQALVEELSKMGPEALTKVQALNQMTQPELDKFVTLWKEKMALATSMAGKELTGLRTEIDGKIEEARLQAEISLSELVITFDTDMKTLETNTTTSINTLKTNFMTAVGELKKDSKIEFGNIVKDITTIMKEPDWNALGLNITESIGAGVRAGKSALIAEVVDAAIEAYMAAKEALQMSSPSKKFLEIGRYTMEGFALGVKNYAGVVVTATKQAALSSLDSFRNAISGISDVIDTSVDPVIRPVLDLSDIKSGSASINRLLSGRNGLSLSGVAGRLPNLSRSEGGSESIEGSPDGTSISFVQNNYSPKALSRLEIYRNTRNQISTLKGVVSGV